MDRDTDLKLQELFRAVFEMAPDVDVRRVQRTDYPGWDSLAHVMLMGALESEFGITVDLADAIELTSYDAVAGYVEEKTR